MNHTAISCTVIVLENIVLEKHCIYYDIFNENSRTMTLKTYKHLKKQSSFIYNVIFSLKTVYLYYYFTRGFLFQFAGIHTVDNVFLQ